MKIFKTIIAFLAITVLLILFWWIALFLNIQYYFPRPLFMRDAILKTGRDIKKAYKISMNEIWEN